MKCAALLLLLMLAGCTYRQGECAETQKIERVCTYDQGDAGPQDGNIGK